LLAGILDGLAVNAKELQAGEACEGLYGGEEFFDSVK
jgi:hypothetical protein